MSRKCSERGGNAGKLLYNAGLLLRRVSEAAQNNSKTADNRADFNIESQGV